MSNKPTDNLEPMLIEGERDCAHCGHKIGWGEPYDFNYPGDEICGGCSDVMPRFRNGPLSAEAGAVIFLQRQLAKIGAGAWRILDHFEDFLFLQEVLGDLVKKDIVPAEIRAANKVMADIMKTADQLRFDIHMPDPREQAFNRRRDQRQCEHCLVCLSLTVKIMEMACWECGSKKCPKAVHHGNTCDNPKKRMEKLMKVEMSDNLREWLLNGERGLSSETIVQHLTGLPLLAKDTWGGIQNIYPHDPADLRRCLLLLEAVPELKADFARMAELSEKWIRLVENWAQLEKLFVEDAGPDWRTRESQWVAKRTYARMKELNGF